LLSTAGGFAAGVLREVSIINSIAGLMLKIDKIESTLGLDDMFLLF